MTSSSGGNGNRAGAERADDAHNNMQQHKRDGSKETKSVLKCKACNHNKEASESTSNKTWKVIASNQSTL